MSESGLVLQLVLVQMVDVQGLAPGGQDLLLLLSLSLFLSSSLLVSLFSAHGYLLVSLCVFV